MQDTNTKNAKSISAPEEQQEEELLDQEESDEGEESEEDEPQEVPRTEFMNLKEALEMGQKQLQRIPHVNPESLRRFLSSDLYPILIELADFANWYIGDLHNRMMNIETEQDDGSSDEALTPEMAEQLINFIGMSLQIFGVILRSPKVDPGLLQTAQILTTQAPGLIARIQEITMTQEPEEGEDEEEEYEDEEEDQEPPAVLEPRKRGVYSAPAPEPMEQEAAAPVVEQAQEETEASGPVVELSSQSVEPTSQTSQTSQTVESYQEDPIPGAPVAVTENPGPEEEKNDA